MSYYEEIKLKLNKELKVRCYVSNIKSEKLALAFMNYTKGFPLFKDFHLLVASHEECMRMVNAGMMDLSQYNFPQRGNYALILDVDAFKYSTTFKAFENTFTDFNSGWDACRGKI